MSGSQRVWWIPVAAAPLVGLLAVVALGGDAGVEAFVIYSAVGLVVAGAATFVALIALRSDAVHWTVAVLALVWGCITLVMFSDGSSLFPDFVVLALGVLLLGITTLTTGAVLLVRNARAGEPLRRLLPVPFVVQGVVLVLVFFAIAFVPAFEVRFALSRAALESTANEVLSGHEIPAPTWIGLFRVDSIDTADKTVRFGLGYSGFVDRFGVVYSPEGEPAAGSDSTYERIDDDWWTWVERF